jgi:hypothetical protein
MSMWHMAKKKLIQETNWHFTTCPETGEIDEYVQCSDKNCRCHSKNLNFGSGKMKREEKKEKFLKKLKNKR